MKLLTSIARILVGLLFIFSGTIKLNDPKGTAYKLEEYFEVFAKDFTRPMDSIFIKVSDNYGTDTAFAFQVNENNPGKTLQVNQSAVMKEGFENEEGGIDTFTGSYLYVVYDNARLYDEFYVLDDPSDLPKVTASVRSGKGKVLFDKQLALSMESKHELSKDLELGEFVVKQSFLVDFFKGLKEFSIYFSIIICVLEVALGFAILIGWQIRIVSWIILLLIIFFTFLTGYTYYTGYCPKPVFMTLALLILLLIIVSAVYIEHKKGRYLGYFTLGLIVVFFLLCRFTDYCFACEFTEGKMRVSDCGCFGDFIKLKPWTSFYKDLILLILILFIFIRRKKIVPLFSPLFGLNAVLVVTIGATVFAVYCNTFLPAWDFLPYKAGNNIRELMTPPKGARLVDLNRSVLVYEKDGKRDSFTIENYPKDTNWKYVTTVTTLIEPAWKSEVHGFQVEPRNENDVNVTDSLLQGKGYYILVVSTHYEEGHKSAWQYIKSLGDEAKKAGVPVYGVTASPLKEADVFAAENQLPFRFHNADETFLKTIIRSNPGIMLWHDGAIIDKWSCRSIPSMQKIKKLMEKKREGK